MARSGSSSEGVPWVCPARWTTQSRDADQFRAKFKKFLTEAAANVYMQGSSAPPYSLPNRSTAPEEPARSTTSAPNRQATSATSQTRASSPPTSIDPHLLPSDLQVFAKQGYTFSKDKRLVVYTDGSGLSNGKVGARAGLGVYWGSEGQAGRSNLSERVPGNLQTNNRGELLVRSLRLSPHGENADIAVSDTCAGTMSLPLHTSRDTYRLAVYYIMYVPPVNIPT